MKNLDSENKNRFLMAPDFNETIKKDNINKLKYALNILFDSDCAETIQNNVGMFFGENESGSKANSQITATTGLKTLHFEFIDNIVTGLGIFAVEGQVGTTTSGRVDNGGEFFLQIQKTRLQNLAGLVNLFQKVFLFDGLNDLFKHKNFGRFTHPGVEDAIGFFGAERRVVEVTTSGGDSKLKYSWHHILPVPPPPVCTSSINKAMPLALQMRCKPWKNSGEASLSPPSL
ncbi:hypothetical protein CVS40_6883 [Lucilia cuprina]|nr:hypothetical protein CVS40_6883 [Lucilia cuprina]